MPRFIALLGALALVVTVGFGCKQEETSTGTLSTDVFTITTTSTQMSTNANVSTIVNRTSDDDEKLGEDEFILEIHTGNKVMSESDFKARYSAAESVELITNPVVTALYGKEPSNSEYSQEVGYLYGNIAYIRILADTATGAAKGREALIGLNWK